jgi:hypothetical protein
MKSKNFSLMTIGLVLTFLSIGMALFLFGPPQIPVWYSLSLPEQQLEQKVAIFLFPITIAVFALLNVSFAKKAGTVEQSLQKLFLYSTIIPFTILSIACIHVLVLVL